MVHPIPYVIHFHKLWKLICILVYHYDSLDYSIDYKNYLNPPIRFLIPLVHSLHYQLIQDHKTINLLLFKERSYILLLNHLSNHNLKLTLYLLLLGKKNYYCCFQWDQHIFHNNIACFTLSQFNFSNLKALASILPLTSNNS